MGVNWAATLLGIIGIILTPSPFLFYKFGARIRAGSTFAPGIVSVVCDYSCGRSIDMALKDLRIARELELEQKAGSA